MAFFIQLSPNGYDAECNVEFSADAKAFKSATLSEALAIYKNEYEQLKLIILLAATDVPEVFLEISKAHQKQLQQGVLSKLEEKVLGDFESYHVVVTKKMADGCLVNYIKKECLERLQKVMSEQKVQCHYVVPIYRAFPSQYFDSENAVMLGNQVYFENEQGAAHVLPSHVYTALSSKEEGLKHTVFACDDRETYFVNDRLSGNLFTKEFEVSLKRKVTNFPWKYVATVAGIGFGLYLLMTAFEGFYYKHKATEYADKQKTLYLQYFPGSKARQYRKEVENKINSAAGLGGDNADEFTVIMNAISSPLSSAKSSLGVEVDRFSFNQDRSSLDINVVAKDFAALEQLKQQLNSSGMVADIGATTNLGDKTRAQLKVTLGGDS